MSENRDRWTLDFFAGFVVPPCRGSSEKAAHEGVSGSAVPIVDIPFDFFYRLFADSLDQFEALIVFRPEDGQQVNEVRTQIRNVAFGDDSERSDASLCLARRLAGVSYRRSGLGLFVVIAGRQEHETRVVVWKFPSDSSLQFGQLDGAFTIRLLEDAFSGRTSKYLKAAGFQGTRSDSAFWKGKVQDLQAKSRPGEAADFWIYDFLAAAPELTGRRGTRLMARALRELIRSTKAVDTKDALMSAATAVRARAGRMLSLTDFANDYLPKEVREAFLRTAGDQEIWNTIFRLDLETLGDEIGFRSLILDNNFSVRGPFDQFEDTVQIEPMPEADVVEVSLRGTIVSHKVGAR